MLYFTQLIVLILSVITIYKNHATLPNDEIYFVVLPFKKLENAN